MIGPPISAYLLTDDLKVMVILSAFIGSLNGVLGYQFASYFDVSIAGSMAVMTGIVFLLVFIFAPNKGLVTIIRRRSLQKKEFAEKSFLFHIFNHEGDENEETELGINTIQAHVNWDKTFLNKMISDLKEEKKIYIEREVIKLTPEGREYAIKSYEEIVSEF